MDTYTSQKILLSATTASELFKELPECVIIKGSLAPYRKRSTLPGTLLHTNPGIELLIVLDKKNLRELKSNFVKVYGNTIIQQRDLDDYFSGKINFMEYERLTGDAGQLIFQFIEPRVLESFCGLSSPLIWNETLRPKVKEFYSFDGQKLTVPLSTLDSYGSFERYSLPALASGKFYSGIRSSILCRSIVLHNKNRYFERVHEKAWKSAVNKLTQEISQNPNQKLSVLNSFDLYHKNGQKAPKRLVDYLEKKTNEHLNISMG